MPLRTIVLEGTVAAGSGMTKIDEVSVPSGLTWRLREIRPYSSVTDGVKIRISHRGRGLTDYASEVINFYKLPSPLDYEFGGGEPITLEASNASGSDAKIVVEIVVEETT